MSSPNDPALFINQLPVSVEIPSDPKQMQEIISLLYKRIADAVNKKEGSLYTLIELGNFQRYFVTADPQTLRNGYRKCFDMVSLNLGPIAPGATVSVPHGITGLFQATRIYGAAKNSDATPRFMPLPFASATGTRNIEIYLTATNVVLVNGSTQTTLTQATIVAEYLKN